MSFISAIRQRSGLVVSVIAVTLVLFVITSILSDPSFSLFQSESNIGTINGEILSTKAFAEKIEKLENDFQIQNNRGPNEQERQQVRDQAWNDLLFDKLYKTQSDKLGLTVTNEEVIDMVQGNNIHPAINQAFTDPNTKVFDKTKIKQFLANFKRLEQRQQIAWLSFEAKLPDDRLRSKYESLLTKTDYVTSAQAKLEYIHSQETIDLQFLYVPYSSVPDSTLKVEDADLRAYLKENQYRYRAQDNRAIDYVQFMLTPSGDDSAAIRTELDVIKTDFATSADDTLFAASHSDSPTKLQTLGVNDLPADLNPIATSLLKGQIYGPFLNGNTYTLYKVVDIAADGNFNVRASHILFKGEKANSDSVKKVSKSQAQDILKKIKGGANFEELARQYGTDGTKDQGGDLGWFDETRMVKPFADAVFAYKGTGLLPNIIETDFGYHIVKVTGAKTNIKYKVVSIQKNITSGDKTNDAVYAQAMSFKQVAQDDASFSKALADQKLNKLTAATINKTGNGFNDVQEGRQVVQWAYADNTGNGDVSTVFELADRYVVALVTKISVEGPASLEDVRDALTNEVRKQKKAESIIAKLGKANTLEEYQKKNVTGTLLSAATDVGISSMAFGDLGYDPEAVGRAFGAKKGQIVPPTKGESGVYAIKVITHKPAPVLDAKADLSTYKQTIISKQVGRTQYFITEALKQVLNVKDERVKVAL